MENKKTNISIYMEWAVIKEATKYAKSKDRSFSWYMNDLAKKDLRKQSMDEPFESKKGSIKKPGSPPRL